MGVMLLDLSFAGGLYAGFPFLSFPACLVFGNVLVPHALFNLNAFCLFIATITVVQVHVLYYAHCIDPFALLILISSDGLVHQIPEISMYQHLGNKIDLLTVLHNKTEPRGKNHL